MNATVLQNIEISEHPTKLLPRRADLLSFSWNAQYKYIKQQYAVFEIDTNGDRDEFSRYEIELYASDAWLVDPATGALLMTQEEYDALVTAKTEQDIRLAEDPELVETPIEIPAPVMGEYSFFLLYAENAIELYPLLLAKVQEADTQRQKFERVK